MKTFLLTVVFIIIVGYILILRKLKADARAYDNVDFDLSVASYKPQIKAGNYKMVLTELGADHDATLKTINRYRVDPLDLLEKNSVVVSNISIYTAEDLLFELNYIGADGEIIQAEA